MGTRAQFFINDPQDEESRELLGCIAWDGYPEAFPEFDDVKSEEDFRKVVDGYKERDDFADPAKGGYPFPWENDLFLTDYTYAWIDGKLMVTCYHSGFVEWEKAKDPDWDWGGDEGIDELPDDVKAPSSYDRKQPDSIMIFTTKKD